MATLRAMGRLRPLAICGLDFDVDEDGRVLFFEADATMNLLSEAPPDMPYPPEAVAALINQLELLFQRKADLAQPALDMNS